jgi:cell division protease FtsH
MTDLLTEIEGDTPAQPRGIWIVAIHESGHAVAGCVQNPGCVDEVCLAAGRDAGGYARADYCTTRHPSADDLKRLIIITLAVRAAEEEIVGTPTSGVGGGPGSNLSKATCLAVEIYTSLGLDEAGS